MNPGGEVVVDSNLLVNLALPKHPFHAQSVRFVADCRQQRVQMLVPHWCETEADTALRRMVFAGLDAVAAAQAQRTLEAAPVSLIYEPAARALARQIADQLHQQRLYDAVYVALAQLRGCELWTGDLRLFNNAQSVGLTFVRSIADY